jgi:hypothetical protein
VTSDANSWVPHGAKGFSRALRAFPTRDRNLPWGLLTAPALIWSIPTSYLRGAAGSKTKRHRRRRACLRLRPLRFSALSSSSWVSGSDRRQIDHDEPPRPRERAYRHINHRTQAASPNEHGLVAPLFLRHGEFAEYAREILNRDIYWQFRTTATLHSLIMIKPGWL